MRGPRRGNFQPVAHPEASDEDLDAAWSEMAALIASYGLFDHPHPSKMGDALWLFTWLAMRADEDGVVMGGGLIAFAELAFLGEAEEAWRRVRRLDERGYVEVRYQGLGFRARILQPRVS